MDKANNFDALRLFASVNVLLQHAAYLEVPWPQPLPLLVAYTSGVPVFFIISGFLITGSLLRHDGDLAAYFSNRVLRIYPALLLNLAVIFVLLVVSGALPGGSILSTDFLRYWMIILATGSEHLANWLVGPYPFRWNATLPFLPTSALWTIVLELGFYLILPAILLPPIRRRRWASLAAIFAVTLYSYHLANAATTNDGIQTTNPLFFWFFGIGAIIRLLWSEIDGLFRGKFVWWALLYAEAVVFVGDQYAISYYHPAFKSTALTLLLAGCVISAAFTWTKLSKVLFSTDLSYGIYLHHVPALMILHALGWRGFPAAGLLIVATTTMAVATWFVVERPALRFKFRAPGNASRDAAAAMSEVDFVPPIELERETNESKFRRYFGEKHIATIRSPIA